MTTEIRALTEADIEPVVRLSLRAWAPVFASFETVLGPEIYRRIYPDWLTSQAEAVARTCRECCRRSAPRRSRTTMSSVS